MENEKIDLTGKFCPYPIVCILKQVDGMKKGSSLKFIVDDPLAIKSIPEELEEYDDVEMSIEKQGKLWQIKIDKSV